MWQNEFVKFIFALPFALILTIQPAVAETFKLSDPGLETAVPYDRYGRFAGVGSSRYQYFISDREGLSKAVGEGIYPNVSSLLKDPALKVFQREGKLNGPVWDYVNGDDVQASFFKWASNHEESPGVRQFYVALSFEKAGLLRQAAKAYYATVVHFPKAFGNTSWKTPWYVGPTALDSLSYLLRQHPELGMRLEGGRIRIRNRYDDDPANDTFEIDPGRLVNASASSAPKPPSLTGMVVQKQLGKGLVHLRQYSNQHWQLIVNKSPYVIRGITYVPSLIGKSPDDQTLVPHRDWMLDDGDRNGHIDGPYDSWVDSNRNNHQDPKETIVGDFKLMQEMGVNTVRLYHHGYNQRLLQDLYDSYGIRVIMGDFVGAYTIGSDAIWSEGTDYRNPEQQEKMLASVKRMVIQYKDEPYILMWMLGNENNYGTANNSRQMPDDYYRFLNKAAQLIKSLDSNHPVAICNGDLQFLDKAAKWCPDVDVFGSNTYRGNHGMGDSFWHDAVDVWGKPVLISEFGCPAYHRHKSVAETEALQADYLRSNWDDIEWNLGGGRGAGNAIGGVIFEWLDEWWKAGAPPTYDAHVQDKMGQFTGPFPDGWSYEEWYGIVSQGNGSQSPFMRQLRSAYFLFKNDLWNLKEWNKRGLPW